jgi:DtxR family Mn-dependent transcriptional regulator
VRVATPFFAGERSIVRDESLSTAVQDYLKAIYALRAEGERVATAAIARSLGVSAGSVTPMLKRLGEEGLLDYEPYRGVTLTERGEKTALRVIRRHRITEQFLLQVLGLTWDQVHQEAERLEHALSDVVIDRMDEFLGHPKVDPHGDPIPTKEGRVREDHARLLADLEPGDRGVVRRVSDADSELLRYAEALGLVPTREIEVMRRDPFGGPLHVRVDGTEHLLGEQIARAVFVEVDERPRRGAGR